MVSEVVNGYITMEHKAHLAAAKQELDTKQLEINQKQEDFQAKERRHQVWSSSHAFTMLRFNNPKASYPYYAIRCKRFEMSGAIKKLRVKHPNSIMVYQNAYVPNPVNLYNRLKACGFLQFKRNYCQSLVGQADLIKKLGDLHAVIE